MSFEDFCSRVPCRLEDIRVLIRSGALDSVSEGLTRPQLFFRWMGIGRGAGPGDGGLGFLPPAPAAVGDYPVSVKLADEVRTLGLVVSRHPLELFRPRIQRMARRHELGPLVRSVDLAERVGSVVWTAGILVTGKEVSTKKRGPMIFVSFEDELAVFETVFFPQAFRRFYSALDDGWAFLVHGRVEDDLGAIAITVERLVMVSRRGGGEAPQAAGMAAAVVAPERPPMMMWGRYHDYGEDPAAGTSLAAAALARPGAAVEPGRPQ